MIHPQLKQKLHQAQRALEAATSDNIVELCKRYLTLLAESRRQLYELRTISQPSTSFTSTESLSDTRKSIRAAIEKTTQERNRTELLLLSITTISGYEAVEMLNRRHYGGYSDWELRASGVKPTNSAAQYLMTVREAVDLASLLRREDCVSQNAARALRESDT
jgi:hypothetical protein